MCNIYSDSTRIRTFYLFLFLLPLFPENTQQDWVTLMKAHNGRFLGNSVNGSKTICIKNRACADPGIFVRGVQVSLTKKSLRFFVVVFFSPQLILQKSNKWSILKKSIIFKVQGSKDDSTFSRGGGSNFFWGGGGSNFLFPI